MCEQELFNRIGRVVKLELRYDRAGRSEGTAFVVYESRDDAREAVKEFDGANAKGILAENACIYINIDDLFQYSVSLLFSPRRVTTF